MKRMTNENATPSDNPDLLVSFKRPQHGPPDVDHPWFCEGCSEWVQCEHVTFEETHDPKNGGCGGDCY